MAAEIPAWLASYLLEKGLFSDRFTAAPEKTKDIKKNKEELTFEQVLRDVLDGGGDYQGSTPDASTSSTDPDSRTSSSATEPSSNRSGMFEDAVDIIGDVLSFDLGQAALDTVSNVTGINTQGLFGFETPDFVSDMQRGGVRSIAEDIANSPNFSTQEKIGAALASAFSFATPGLMSIAGMAMNAYGGPNLDLEPGNQTIAYDPISGVVAYGPNVARERDADPEVGSVETGGFGRAEPNQISSVLDALADLQTADLQTAFDVRGATAYDLGLDPASYSTLGDIAFADFGVNPAAFGATNAVSPAFGTLSLNPARGTLGRVGALGQGAFGQGAYSARADFTSPYGLMSDYHSPSFDPGGRSPSISSPSFDPDTGEIDMGFETSSVGPGRSAGIGGPSLDYSNDMSGFGGAADDAAGHDTDPGKDIF